MVHKSWECFLVFTYAQVVNTKPAYNLRQLCTAIDPDLRRTIDSRLVIDAYRLTRNFWTLHKHYSTSNQSMGRSIFQE